MRYKKYFPIVVFLITFYLMVTLNLFREVKTHESYAVELVNGINTAVTLGIAFIFFYIPYGRDQERYQLSKVQIWVIIGAVSLSITQINSTYSFLVDANYSYAIKRSLINLNFIISVILSIMSNVAVRERSVRVTPRQDE